MLIIIIYIRICKYINIYFMMETKKIYQSLFKKIWKLSKKKKNHQAAVEDYHNVLAHQVINICSWIIENNRQQHKNAKFVMDYR